MFLLFVGTFMEALAAIVILTPVLLPVVEKLSVDPVHFGIIMVVKISLPLSQGDCQGGAAAGAVTDDALFARSRCGAGRNR